MLLEATDPAGQRLLTDQEIKDEVLTMMFAVSKNKLEYLDLTSVICCFWPWPFIWNPVWIINNFLISQGQDTTSVSMGFVLSLLGLKEDIQVKKILVKHNLMQRTF